MLTFTECQYAVFVKKYAIDQGEIMIEDEAKHFCENVKELRKANGLSQKEMAQKLDISVNSLSMLEKGTIPPRLSVSIVIKIHKSFGVKPAQMFVKQLFI